MDEMRHHLNASASAIIKWAFITFMKKVSIENEVQRLYNVELGPTYGQIMSSLKFLDLVYFAKVNIFYSVNF